MNLFYSLPSPWRTLSKLQLKQEISIHSLVGNKNIYMSLDKNIDLNFLDKTYICHFLILEAAVKAAGLVETLSTGGPFTVFAPTDAAFAKLPAGTVDGMNAFQICSYISVLPFSTLLLYAQFTALLKDIPKLTSILTYHVVAGKVRPTRNGKTYDTLNGKEISSKVTVDTTDVIEKSVFHILLLTSFKLWITL